MERQRCRLLEEEIDHLRRILTLHTDRVDCDSWHQRAWGAQAKMTVQEMSQR